MYKNSLNSSKRHIVNEGFKDKNTGERIWNNTVVFCGETFNIYEPNFNGGSIESNCKILNGEDFNVIDTFDLKYLEDLEKDILYLQKLINARKNELLPIETKTELIIDKYKDGNKRLCSITIRQYNKQKDIYGDRNITNDYNLEHHIFSDTKANQENINSKIEELKVKYNLTESNI